MLFFSNLQITMTRVEPNSSVLTKAAAGNASWSVNHNHLKRYDSIHRVGLDIRLSIYLLVTIASTAGFLGNLCVLRFLRKKETKKTPGIKASSNLNIFIRSLAISDVLVSISVVPLTYIRLFYRLSQTQWSCRIRSFIALLFPVITIYNIVVIGLERYILTCRPTSRPLSRATTEKLVKGAWLLGFFVTFLPAFTKNSLRIELNETHYTISCRHDNSNILNILMFQFFIGIAYVLPFVFIIFTCASIIRMVWKMKFQVAVAEKDVALALRKWRLKQRKATLILIAIIIALLVPYFLYAVYFTFNMIFKPTVDHKTDFLVRNVAAIFAYLNSFVNYCIHLAQLPGFRAYFKSSVCCMKPKTNALQMQVQDNGHEVQMQRIQAEPSVPNNKEQCDKEFRRASMVIIPKSDICYLLSARRYSI